MGLKENYYAATGAIEGHLCNCVGPRDGKPLCPCMMRGVTVENGRYVRKQDLGPVETGPTPVNGNGR